MPSKSKYSAKKQRMSSGSYHGNSPFFVNIPEFQYLKPLSTYPHLRVGTARVGSSERRQTFSVKPSILETLSETNNIYDIN